MNIDPTRPPDPIKGWSFTSEELENALVVPPQNVEGRLLTTAVYGQTGALCHHAVTWRRDVAITLPPEQTPTAKRKLKGRWLYGGVLYHHFGHFQVESLARLWKLPSEDGKLSGILFVERQKKGRLLAFERDYFKLLGCDLPIKLIGTPTEVESLLVPGQASGLGKIAPATRLFRRYIRSHFAQEVEPQGGSKLFISRSKQAESTGGFLGEEVLDARMRSAGYEVFWPEHHSLDVQVARYKAAERIVALDGSALHLVAMTARPRQKTAIILRRPRIASRSLRVQMGWFMDSPPLVINAFHGETETVLGKKRIITDLDFEKIGKGLKKAGFIDRKLDWGPLNESELAQLVP